VERCSDRPRGAAAGWLVRKWTGAGRGGGRGGGAAPRGGPSLMGANPVNVERVTVLSGNFLLGKGENMNKANTERLEAGSYTSMPPGMVHFVFIEGETVVQISTVGPWEINYVNPEEDDPRLR
jgi:hypothetical protein